MNSLNNICNLKKGKVYVYLLFLFLLSCKLNDNKYDRLVASCDIKVDYNSWSYSDYFKIDSAIALETKEHSYFANVDMLHALGDRIFILDRESNSLLLFSTSGEFISRLNRKGKGVREYISIASFDVTKDALYLLVWQGTQKLMKFDHELNFISEKKMDLRCNSFKVLNDRIYMYCGNYCNKNLKDGDVNFNFVVLDTKFNVVIKDLPFNNSFCNRATNYGYSKGSYLRYTLNNTLFLTKTYANCIYKIEGDEIVEIKMLDFGKEMSSPNLQIDYKRFELDKKISESNSFKSVFNLYEIGNLLFFESFGNSFYRCVCDSGRVSVAKNQGIDPEFGVMLKNIVGNYPDNKMIIAAVDASHLKIRYDKYKESLDETLVGISDKLTIDNNSILLFLTLK